MNKCKKGNGEKLQKFEENVTNFKKGLHQNFATLANSTLQFLTMNSANVFKYFCCCLNNNCALNVHGAKSQSFGIEVSMIHT